MKTSSITIAGLVKAVLVVCLIGLPAMSLAQTWLDNTCVWPDNDPTINVRRSDHFRIVWGNGQNPNTSSQYSYVTEDMVQGNLQEFEHAWHVLHDAAPNGAGLHIPWQSNNPVYQDGNSYRDNFEFFNTGIDAGGGTGTMDAYGFPWFGGSPPDLRYDPSPDSSLHGTYTQC